MAEALGRRRVSFRIVRRHGRGYLRCGIGSSWPSLQKKEHMMRIRWIVQFALSLVVGSVFGADEPKLAITGVKEDIEFATPGGVSLKLDAFIPEGPGRFPTCILVHGGGWRNGNKRVYITPLFEP